MLLVDDDDASLIQLHDTLHTVAVDVLATTNSGERAIDVARLLQPDLAPIDWDMRSFGGALESIRPNSSDPSSVSR